MRAATLYLSLLVAYNLYPNTYLGGDGNCCKPDRQVRSLMQKVIGVTEMQRNFRAIFDEVAEEHIPYVLTRGSRPEAALIPYETFLRLLELQEQEVLTRFDRLAARVATHNEAYSEEEITADITAALAEVRAHTVQ